MKTLRLLALALPVAVAACSWTVPADPGRNSRLRSRAGASFQPVSAAAPGAPYVDESAGAVYVARCSRCHEPFSPSRFSAAEWPALVQRYGPRAGLFGSERARVLAWLQAHAQ